MGGGFMGALANDFIDTMDYPIMRFIKAEIVSFDDLISAGSMNAAKAAGKVRMEGKEYVMRDGDVVEFRFNV